MRLGSPGFVGSRLVAAREARGLSAAEIAKLVSVTRQTVSQWEHGHQTPHPMKLSFLSQALEVPKGYFFRASPTKVTRSVFYRSLNSATKKARVRSEGKYEWLREIVAYLEESFEFPQQNFPSIDVPRDFKDISDDDIESIAASSRLHWGTSEGPIQDLSLLVENNGGIISRFRFGSEAISSFSEWCPFDNRPFFVLGTDHANAFRSRFDLAHEIGHAILHRQVSRAEITQAQHFKLLESQAFRFASAFLLPAEAFCADLWAPTLDAYNALKPRWKVSIASMIYRSRQLDLVNDDYAQRLWMTLSRKGWKRKEPLDDLEPVETPRLLRRSIEMLMEEGQMKPSQILASIRLAASDVEELTGLEPGRLSESKAEVVHLPKMLDRESREGGNSSADSSNVIPVDFSIRKSGSS